MRELSLNVMDIVQNSVKAKASLIEILLTEDFDKDRLTIEINDNGCGMSEEQVKTVTDPFFTTRTTRKVGMGVPLFKMAAEMTGGSFEISSKIGVGTKLCATFVPSSIDMTPVGNMTDTVLPLVTGNEEIDFLYARTRTKCEKTESFSLDTRELKATLGEDVPLNLPEVVLWIKEFLDENTKELSKKIK